MEKEFERYEITADTLLIGHSCGGGFLFRYVSEHQKMQFGRVILVAPWMNPDQNPVSNTADFFEFEIDPKLVSRTKCVTIYISSNDDPSVVKSVDIIKTTIADVSVQQYADRGHFTTPEFPELLESILA